MKKTEISVLLGLIIAIILTSVTTFAKDCRNVRSEVLRLHILANSDSQQDQEVKIMVRDAILEHSNELFDGSKKLSDAVLSAEQNLDDIVKIANNELKKTGFDYTAKAEICDMYFETRKYDDVTLPAGYYKALRIKLGKAEGKNWWCVLFPALCIPASQDSVKMQDIFSQSEFETVTQPKYEAKFAIVEFIQWLKK